MPRILEFSAIAINKLHYSVKFTYQNSGFSTFSEQNGENSELDRKSFVNLQIHIPKIT